MSNKLVKKKHAKKVMEEGFKDAERANDKLAAVFVHYPGEVGIKSLTVLKYIHSNHISSVDTNNRINEIANEYAEGGRTETIRSIYQGRNEIYVKTIDGFIDALSYMDDSDVICEIDHNFTTFMVWQAVRDDEIIPGRILEKRGHKMGRSFFKVCQSFCRISGLNIKLQDNPRRVIRIVKRGLRRLDKQGYDEIAVSRYTNSIWYKPWFREKMLEEGFSYLPRK